MAKLEELTQQRKAAHTKLKSLNSRVYAAFLEMEKAAYSDGVIGGEGHCW